MIVDPDLPRDAWYVFPRRRCPPTPEKRAEIAREILETVELPEQVYTTILAFGLYPPFDPEDVMRVEVANAFPEGSTQLEERSWSPYVWDSDLRPECKHARLAETGFGSAYCKDCDAKLRRDEHLNWGVVP